MAGGENGPPVLNGAEFEPAVRTLDDLTNDLMLRLGFIDQMANVPKRTLAQMRTDVLTVMGFPDPITTVATRTLVLLREDVIRRLGYYYAATLPDGMAALVNGIINEAYQTIWRRLELDKGGVALPSRLVNDADATTIDYVPVQVLAIAMAKAHYRQPDAELYFKLLEQLLGDLARRRPPNIEDVVNTNLRMAQETVYRRIEVNTQHYALNALTADSDATTIDFWPVQTLATALTKAKYEQRDAKIYFDELERWLADYAARSPPNARGLAKSFLQDANTQLFWAYPVARNKRWFSIETVAGSRFYDVPYFGDGFAELRRVEYVGYQQGDAWTQMYEGISPANFNNTSQSWPSRYKLGRYLEVWPTPDDVYTIWLYGMLGLAAFKDDEDLPSVDDHAVFTLALANAKAHYKQPDAGGILRQHQQLVGHYVASSHAGKRYVPGYGVPQADLPQPTTTFPRG